MTLSAVYRGMVIQRANLKRTRHNEWWNGTHSARLTFGCVLNGICPGYERRDGMETVMHVAYLHA